MLRRAALRSPAPMSDIRVEADVPHLDWGFWGVSAGFFTSDR